jgi:hypothetical protein
LQRHARVEDILTDMTCDYDNLIWRERPTESTKACMLQHGGFFEEVEEESWQPSKQR